jgi:hypothetical protein
VSRSSCISPACRRHPNTRHSMTLIRSTRVTLAENERALLVARVAGLLRQLHLTNSDSSLEGEERRELLKGELRRAGPILWLNTSAND